MLNTISKVVTQDEFVTLVADKAGFTKSDIKIILNTFVEVFTELVKQRIIIKIRGFGKLYYEHVPAHKGHNHFTNKEIWLKDMTKVKFRLAENIRFAKEEGGNEYEI